MQRQISLCCITTLSFLFWSKKGTAVVPTCILYFRERKILINAFTRRSIKRKSHKTQRQYIVKQPKIDAKTELTQTSRTGRVIDCKEPKKRSEEMKFVRFHSNVLLKNILANDKPKICLWMEHSSVNNRNCKTICVVILHPSSRAHVLRLFNWKWPRNGWNWIIILTIEPLVQFTHYADYSFFFLWKQL